MSSMPARIRPVRDSTRILMLGILAFLMVLPTLLPRAMATIGTDFINYWSAGLVLRVAPDTLHNPFVQAEAFRTRLIDHLSTTDSHQVNTVVHEAVTSGHVPIDYRSTPLAYFVFSWGSSDVGIASQVYRLIQTGMFVLVVLGVARSALGSWLGALLLAVLLVLGFEPFLADFRVGNSNVLVLALLAVAFWGLGAFSSFPVGRAEASPPGTVWRQALGVWLVGATVLLKPTLGPLLGVVVGLVLLGLGWRRGLAAGALGGVAILGTALLPTWRFGAWTLWGDWLSLIATQGMETNADQKAEMANVAFNPVLAGVLDLPRAVTALGLGLLFLVPMVPVLVNRGRRGLDPGLILSLGLFLTIAVTPFMWVHYYTVLILPALVAAQPRYRETALPILGLLTLVLSSMTIVSSLRQLLPGVTLGQGVEHTILMVSWIPLWVGMARQAVIAARAAGEGGQAAAQAA
ncbi:MAG: hypothetical protein HQL82_14825 [Magnetococcales bacterium]|nr:hypothetical protein [Magnetococcales bacterium]